MGEERSIFLFNSVEPAPQWWIDYVWQSPDQIWAQGPDQLNQRLAPLGCEFRLRGSDRLLVFSDDRAYLEFVMRYVEI